MTGIRFNFIEKLFSYRKGFNYFLKDVTYIVGERSKNNLLSMHSSYKYQILMYLGPGREPLLWTILNEYELKELFDNNTFVREHENR